MATDANLRDLFRAKQPGVRSIDTQAVIRRTKARRLPRQIGIGGVFTLAIGGISVAGLQGLGMQTASQNSASSSSEESVTGANDAAGGWTPATDGALPETTQGMKRAPADRLNLCGGTVVEAAPSPSGLVLTVNFPNAPVGTQSITGTATLTNTGSAPVTGYASATPAITLSQGGLVLWHSNGPTIQMIHDVALAPGESLDFAASFTPVACSVEDDLAESFRADLPPVPAGEYELSAAADVMVGDDLQLVTGPRQVVRIG